jgi:hydroxypyruvate isomerase
MIRIAGNLSTLYGALSWPERFLAARADGFDGVEIQFPYSEPAPALTTAASAAALPVVLINGPIDLATYPFGIAGVLGQRSVFREQLPMIETYARALGVRYVHILAGLIDSETDRARALEVYAENLSLAAEWLRPSGIEVLIEPLNGTDAPRYLLDSFDLAAEVIRRCEGAVGLQFDFYHAARMRVDVLRELKRRFTLIRHIQFADAPGRHEPGTGQLAFEPLIAQLVAMGYAGWLGAEYFPRASRAQGLPWLGKWRDLMSR